MTKASKVTPLMKQYNDIKSKYPDAILLFRVGDFYETFGDDAVVASKVLGIVLTKRGAGSTSETELAGFPHHSIGNYLPKLVKSGSGALAGLDFHSLPIFFIISGAFKLGCSFL